VYLNLAGNLSSMSHPKTKPQVLVFATATLRHVVGGSLAISDVGSTPYTLYAFKFPDIYLRSGVSSVSTLYIPRSFSFNKSQYTLRRPKIPIVITIYFEGWLPITTVITNSLEIPRGATSVVVIYYKST
jgi:hypothetical protein